MRISASTSVLLACLCSATAGFGQRAPSSPDRPWRPTADARAIADANVDRGSPSWIDPQKTYSLAELIDLAQAHNPETRVAWEQARAQSAALGIARSELYPTLAAAAVSAAAREDILFNDMFIRQTVQASEVALDLSYTILDFGARAGRIDTATAEQLAANFAFNDAHRRVVYQVAQAYYQLLNASGQEEAAQASVANAQTVQRAAEERLQHGLATLPDVLEARSAAAQAQYDLLATQGAEEIAQGDLATALGTLPTIPIRVQPLDEVPTPASIGDTVDQAIDRALTQRPDLQQQVAGIRAAAGTIREARAAYYPELTIGARPGLASLFGFQPPFPRAHRDDLLGRVSVNLNWTVFDGGARKRSLERAHADARAADAQVGQARDQVANEVWTAYSRFKTSLGQHQAAIAFVDAANQSYAAALESYNLGVRSLLDVTAAQRVLAQARAADVLARALVLTAVAELAFRTGDSLFAGAGAARP